MKKSFRYIALFLFCLCLGVGLTACEDATTIKAASFMDISISGAKNYGVGVKFMDDKRLEGKSVDVQVKADKEMKDVSIWEDNGAKYTFNIDKADEWMSITTIFVNAQEKPDTETFENFEMASSRRYLFASKKPLKLTFRVVAGQAVDNAEKSGQVLTGSVPISDEFTLKVDAKDDNNIED